MRATTTTALALTAAVALTACGSDDAGTTVGQEEPTATTSTVGETEADEPELDPTDEAPEADPSTVAPDPSETQESTSREGDDDQASPSQPAATVPTLDAGCETDRLLIRYPEGWWTNPGEKAPACRYFHPTEIEVQNESLHYAVFLTIDNVPFERATQEQDGEIHRETFTVHGRDAVETEVESDGRGLIPEGETSTHVFIDLEEDGTTLILSTHTVGDTDYERDAAVLRRMGEALEFKG